jgi:regulator of protease activity HflC (stomatin/prohibitin superfamily)
MVIDAMLYFQITNPIKAAYEIEDLFKAVELLTQTSLRNVIGELNLDQVLASRDIINTKLCAISHNVSDKWGIKIIRIELQDINPMEQTMLRLSMLQPVLLY